MRQTNGQRVSDRAGRTRGRPSKRAEGHGPSDREQHPCATRPATRLAHCPNHIILHTIRPPPVQCNCGAERISRGPKLQRLSRTLDGVPPSDLASVHSSVTITRIPFFLAIAVTERVALLLPAGLLVIGDAARTLALPRKAERKFSVSDIGVILDLYK